MTEVTAAEKFNIDTKKISYINVYNISEEKLAELKELYPDIDIFNRGKHPFITVSIQHQMNLQNSDVEKFIDEIETFIIG